MAGSAYYASMADQMLRLSTAATTDVERAGYLKLAQAWRQLAAEVVALEARKQAEASQEQPSFDPDASSPRAAR